MTTHLIDTTASLHPAPDKRIASGKGRAGAVPHRWDRHKNTVEFRLIFATAFFIFLFLSTLERAMPSRWMGNGHETSARKSIIAQAKESASIAAGYAFMG